MSQASVSSYFNTRKRPIDDDKTISNKNKVICLERALTLQNSNYDPSGTKVVFQDDAVQSRPSRTSLRQEISAQRSRRAVTEDASPKVANFYKMGNLSPQKKVYVAKPYELKTPEKDPKDVETSTKQLIPSVAPATISSPALSRGQLMAQMGAEEIRKKLQKSSKLAELKTKLNSIQCNLDRVDKLERRNSALPKKPMPKKFEALTDESPKKSLKAFNNIELEIIRSVFDCFVFLNLMCFIKNTHPLIFLALESNLHHHLS